MTWRQDPQGSSNDWFRSDGAYVTTLPMPNPRPWVACDRLGHPYTSPTFGRPRLQRWATAEAAMKAVDERWPLLHVKGTN